MEQLSPLKVFYSDKRFVETRGAWESLTRAPVCTANLSKINALELFSVLKQVLKPVNRVCYSKIREVSKEHAQITSGLLQRFLTKSKQTNYASTQAKRIISQTLKAMQERNPRVVGCNSTCLGFASSKIGSNKSFGISDS